ncbi:hypothetical protein V8G54_015419 [Vigna mungo]|uniref:Uncharacterized protein n=1 Tax=Vigna mungo TaxID=3915 RepID=A0AAQ3NIH8_VIGMU
MANHLFSTYGIAHRFLAVNYFTNNMQAFFSIYLKFLYTSYVQLFLISRQNCFQMLLLLYFSPLLMNYKYRNRNLNTRITPKIISNTTEHTNACKLITTPIRQHSQA